MANDTYTIEQYNILCSAIAQGVTSVWYGDKKIEYRTLPEMLRIKSLMENYLGIGPKNPKKKVASFTKGLC